MNGYDKEYIESLQKLISIKSVKYDGSDSYEPVPGKPFGEGIAAALDYTLELCESIGMTVKNCDGYAGYAEIGKGDEMLGVLMHLDVVPEGNDWDFPPYGGEIHDGKLYGRGAIDDKGPAAAVIYAIKELRAEGYEFNKRIRLIFGCDEENDWECMGYYVANEECPDFGFTPDADFPMIYGEMGIMDAEFVMDLPGSETLVISGGEASNAVPDYCKAVIGDEVVAKAHGVAAHASTPWEGKNAISKVMAEVGAKIGAGTGIEADGDANGALECSDEMKKFIQFYNEKIGAAIHGENIGCGFEDEETGKLTFNAGVLSVKDNQVRLAVDLRVPVTVGAEEVRSNLEKAAAEYGVRLENYGFMDPVFSPKDSKLAKTLLGVYRDYTGDNSEPLTMGGGTYARAMPDVVAFGPLFPGREATEHMKNEYILVSDLMDIKEIYKRAIRALCEG